MSANGSGRPAPPDGLTRSVLAERLANSGRHMRTYDHDIWYQQQIPAGQKDKSAAVLVPLIEREDALYLLLTQRTTYLNAHTGQISFPGGGVEAHDRHRQDTALRETEEEIGLPRESIDVIGQLPDHEMTSGFRITPVVGWILPPYRTRLDPLEVQDVFEVPFRHFLQAEHYQRRRYVLDGVERKYLAIPYDGRYIWGATAGMLYSFYQLLRG